MSGAHPWLFLLAGNPLFACAVCRPLVRAQVYDPRFLPNLMVMALPILILLAIGIGIHYADGRAAGERDGGGDATLH
jgi:hypothetical protein